MKTTSFQETLERVARETMESRLKTWLTYTWEKEILPAIIAEATKNVRVTCMTMADCPEEIRVRLRFDPSVPLTDR